MSNNKEHTVKCKCGGHMITIDADTTEKFPDIYINLWYQAGIEDGRFLTRLKRMWDILTDNRIFLYDVLLSQKDAKELGEFLIRVNEENKWKELKNRITIHKFATMDAPYFGWSKEFINGYSEAISRIKEDIKKIENN